MLEKVAIKNKRAMVEGYRVGVKTGTARKIENGHYVNKYVAFTAGIAPISDPRYALVILINDPKAGQYYGGAVSAPVFSNIMVMHYVRMVLRQMQNQQKNSKTHCSLKRSKT